MFKLQRITALQDNTPSRNFANECINEQGFKQSSLNKYNHNESKGPARPKRGSTTVSRGFSTDECICGNNGAKIMTKKLCSFTRCA